MSKYYSCVLFFAVLLPAVSQAEEVAVKDCFKIRGGISNSLCLFDSDDYHQIAFFGGKVLENKQCYYDPVIKRFRDRYPGARFGPKHFPDRNGAWFGAFRVLWAEPLTGFHNPRLVFLDFVSEDEGIGEKEFFDAWEGMVRAMRAFNRTNDLVLIYTLSPKMLDDFRAGKTPDQIRWGETLADRYGLSSLNLAKYAAGKILAGKIAEKDFFADGVAPSPKGAELYAECSVAFVDACVAERLPEKKPVAHEMPEPISPTNMQYGRVVDYDWAASLPEHAITGVASPDKYFRHVLLIDKPNEALTMKFKGAAIGLLDLVDAKTAVYEYSVDGSDWKTPQTETNDSETPVVRAVKIASGLDPAKEHELKLRIAAGREPRRVQIGAFLVDGTVKNPYTGMAPLEKADTVYAAMKPIDYEPPKDRWKYLPKTMEKLRNGDKLKIVMLGDSIMGDTGSSNYDKILERHYPKCKVERIMSLRGSTGCWWYKDENRVENYVLRHEPDLLMIGGISQREDIDAIRSVIHQVREKQSPEILLISPVFGAERDPHLKNWTFEIDPEKYAYRANLKKLAEEEKCEFLDLTGVTWKYMLDSGKCYGWFMRDAVHANERGFQVIGRHLVRYFE